MSRVKIILEDGETLEQVQEDLVKAINHQTNGGTHDEEQFIDPCMIDLANRLEAMHKDIYRDILEEVGEALDSDFSGNGY